MQIRDNIRERRRERIEQLILQHAKPYDEEGSQPRQQDDDTHKLEQISEVASWTDRVDAVQPQSSSKPPLSVIPGKAEPRQVNPSREFAAGVTQAEPDPELWWKEREKQMKTDKAAVGWQGIKGLPPTSSARSTIPPSSFDISKLIRGLILRLIYSAVVFAGLWGWVKLDLPGSEHAHDWMVNSVTRDMDFQAIEAWYGDTFGGYPAFVPFLRNEFDTKEVSALLSPTETSIPVRGKLVQSYAENGSGIKVAASGGSEVSAIYTGRVQQVIQNQDGGITIIVQHPNHIVTVYGNLESSRVSTNDWVETGQLLGQLYSSGDSRSEAVLYFAVQQNGKSFNPLDVVSFD